MFVRGRELGASWFGLAAAVLGACGGETVYGDRCGPGTAADGGVCYPVPVDASVLTCGPGTVLVEGTCAPEQRDAGDAGPDVTLTIDAASPCAIGDDVFMIAGKDSIYSGPPLVLQGDAGAGIVTYEKVSGLASWAEITVGPWRVRLSTRMLGTPLAAGIYTNVGFGAGVEPNQAGLDVSWSVGCAAGESSRFTIVNLSFATNGDLDSITANYEQHCENATDFNYGCVHVKR